MAYESVEMFGKIFMPKALSADTPAFHREIYRDLADNSIKRLGIIAPRGHSKSTVTSIVYPLWRVLFKPKGEDLMIILISESQQQSINFLSIIKNNLAENQRIRHYFGDLVGSKWTEDDITTSNGVRIIARGTGQRIRGMLTGKESITRPNLVILDDFESETNSLTAEAIDKNKDWITKAVEPSLSDDGRIIAIGTIISRRAFLQDIQKEESGWKTHFYQAFADGREMKIPLWPERFSKERLMEIYGSYKARGKPAAFWQEYMNEPIDIENQTFRQDDFKYYPEEADIEIVDGVQAVMSAKYHPEYRDHGLDPHHKIPMAVSIGVDLAISMEKTADFTVIFPLAVDPWGNRFILDYRKFRESDIDMIVENMLQEVIRTKAGMMNIETVQFQQAVANQFRKRMDEAQVYVGVSETKPRTAKDARIRSLQPLFRAGRVYMKPSMTDLEEELLNFPAASHDDLLDGFWLAEQEATEPDLAPFAGDELPVGADDEKEMSWLVL